MIDPSFVYRPVEPGAVYEFKLISLNGYLESAPSSPVRAEVDAGPPPWACHEQETTFLGCDLIGCGVVGERLAGITLFDHPVTVYTDRCNSAAYVEIPGLEVGDYIIIQRTIKALPKTGDHAFLRHSDVETRNLGWESCGHIVTSLPLSTNRITQIVDGNFHAVRPCVVHNGVLRCAEWWYADFEFDIGICGH